MASRNSLVNEVKNVFEKALKYRTDLDQRRGRDLRPAKKDVVYEAYLYSITVQALYDLGYNPVPVNPRAGRFSFRRAPGDLDTARLQCSYVEFQKSGVYYQLYCDVRVLSRSHGVRLEVDILILSSEHAVFCEKTNAHPSFNELRLLIEAKDHAKGIDLSVAKSFIGSVDRLRNDKSVVAIVASGPARGSTEALISGLSPSIPVVANVHGSIYTSPAAVHLKEFLKRELVKVL